MFSIPSLGKLVVLGAVLVLVWYGFKFLGRLQDARETEAALRQGQTKPEKSGSKSKADSPVEMVPCPKCGAYIPAGGSCSSCDQQG